MVTRVRPLKKDRVYSEEEFMNLPDNGKHYELWEGRLIEKMSPGMPHGRIAGFIVTEINIYLRKNPIGTACSNDTFFRLAPGIVVGADIAFVAAGRFSEEPEGIVPFAPDLAVEVISPSDNYGQVDQKIEKYLAGGTSLVWLVNPGRNKITVYRQGSDLETVLGINDELEGEDVLPGFKVRVGNIFKM